jgi:ribosomal protein S18 acetylase RimI-like enzyme
MTGIVDPLALERATLRAWPAARREERFGWVLQATSGQSRRINSVWPLGWTGETSLNAAIGEAEAWLRAQGITPCFKIIDGASAPPDLPAALSVRGYERYMHTLVMTRPLVDAASDRGADISILPDPDDDFFAPLKADAPSRAEYEERRDALKRTPRPRAFALIHDPEGVAAMGACVVTDDLASIFAMRTARPAQRRGLARRLLGALLRWAAAQDARLALLQVEADNQPAVRLYGSEGFATAYSYHHWRAE